MFVHGDVETLCAWKKHRPDSSVSVQCKAERQEGCDLRNENFLRAHADKRSQLPVLFCVNPDLAGWYYTFPNPGTHLKYTNFELLNKVSTFGLAINVSVLSKLPHLSTQFAGNNYGSWVDVVMEMINDDKTNNSSDITVMEPPLLITPNRTGTSDFDRKYTKKNIFPRKHTFELFPDDMRFILWFQAKLDKLEQNVHLTMNVFAVFSTYSSYFVFNSLEWEGSVTLSRNMPQFCLSVGGVISAANLTMNNTSMDQDGGELCLCNSEGTWTLSAYCASCCCGSVLPGNILTHYTAFHCVVKL